MKKILLLLLLQVHLTAIAQVCVEADQLYNSDGLIISYCTESIGKEGVCNKFRVTISISNHSAVRKTMAGNIHIATDIGDWPAAGRCNKNA
jgi:hypothetical protein